MKAEKWSDKRKQKMALNRWTMLECKELMSIINSVLHFWVHIPPTTPPMEKENSKPEIIRRRKGKIRVHYNEAKRRWHVRLSINSIYNTGSQSHSLSQKKPSMGGRQEMHLGQGWDIPKKETLETPISSFTHIVGHWWMSINQGSIAETGNRCAEIHCYARTVNERLGL